MTALFAVAMVIIGSQVEVEGKGAGLMVALANQLETTLGPAGRWIFLAGAWGAVFSSLFGVWQSVPYVFSDFVSLWLKESDEAQKQRVSTRSSTYRFYLLFLAVAPIFTLWFGFQSIQKYYAVFGACFMPFLAAVLIYLNGSTRHIGPKHHNHWSTNAILTLTLLFFGLALYFVARSKLG
jgi:Mn2+/Fe2+ NRAMP family transporter